MIKKIIALLQKIKCKINCCYESNCSINEENKINDISIDNETDLRSSF